MPESALDLRLGELAVVAPLVLCLLALSDADVGALATAAQGDFTIRIWDAAGKLERAVTWPGHAVAALATETRLLGDATPGARLELAVDTTTPEMARNLASVSKAMLEEWTKTKKAPHHADWVHNK